jgi:undecaprenyl-diphosphatase
MDVYFFQITNQFVAQSATLFFMAVDSAEASWKLAALTIVALWFSGISTYSQQTYIGDLRKGGKQQRIIRSRVIMMFAVMVLGFVAARVLQHFFEQTRPMASQTMLIPFNPAIWIKMKTHISEQGSFPSDHAVMWFTIATGTFLLHRIAGTFALITATVLCIFRMGTGYHWFSDILAGTALGVSFTVGTFFILERISFVEDLLLWLVDRFEEHSVPMYALGFLIVSDFSVKFSGLFHFLKEMLELSVGH